VAEPRLCEGGRSMVARRRGWKEGRGRYTCAARNAVDWVCFSRHSIAVELTWSACMRRER
jgi:hypothetical protein